MIGRFFKALRRGLTDDEFVEIKSAIIHDYTINDLQSQIEFLNLDKKVRHNHIKELEEQLEQATKEAEYYRDKYIKADVDNFNQVVRNAKQQAEINNLIYRLQKYEGSPQEE